MNNLRRRLIVRLAELVYWQVPLALLVHQRSRHSHMATTAQEAAAACCAALLGAAPPSGRAAPVELVPAAACHSSQRFAGAHSSASARAVRRRGSATSRETSAARLRPAKGGGGAVRAVRRRQWRWATIRCGVQLLLVRCVAMCSVRGGKGRSSPDLSAARALPDCPGPPAPLRRTCVRAGSAVPSDPPKTHRLPHPRWPVRR